jgi:hypothetical protein
LDLQPGEKADLEVVARAAIAFSEAVKEVAFFLDPSLEIRVELESGSEGSLSLNSIIKSIKTADGKDITLAAIGGVVLIWFGNHVLDWGFEKVMDAVTGGSETVQVEMHIPQEEKKYLDSLVEKAVNGRVGQEHVQQVYRELEVDPKIKGVGATRVPARRPSHIIPREEFPERSGATAPQELDAAVSTRAPETLETLVLIRPVLLPGHRRWRFAGRQGEFGAPILDDEFLQNLYAGNVPVQMSGGIEMDVVLQTIEEKIGSVWVPTYRNVLKVRGVRPAPAQQVLNLPPPAPEDEDDDD